MKKKLLEPDYKEVIREYEEGFEPRKELTEVQKAGCEK